MKDGGSRREEKRVIRLRHTGRPAQAEHWWQFLACIQDRRVRRQVTDWYCLKDKLLFFFSLLMLSVLTLVSILVIVGEYDLYVKTSSAVSLALLVRRLTAYLLKCV